MAVRPPIINVLSRAAEKAGRSLVKDFGEVEHLQVSRKGPADFVSVADIRAQEILHEELSKARPDYAFLAEEGASGTWAPYDGDRFIIDPLDGTTNFLHGLPHWAISLAVESKGEVVAAVVYEPLRDEMFWAAKGAGAFVNHHRLRVSSRKDLSQSLLVTGIPFKGSRDDGPLFLAQLNTLMNQVAGVRRSGSAALDLSYVAAGRFDAYWELSIQPWDVAAGLLLVREAGGFTRGLPGGGPALFAEGCFAANAELFELVWGILQGVKTPA